MKGFVDLVKRHRVAAVLLFLLVFPLLMPYHALAINILLFGLFAVGFNLLFGYTGLLSFGHALFLGVDPYPRKPDAVFDHAATPSDPKDHPFAALKALKAKPKAKRKPKGE